jgi:hypothetical protein
MLAYCKEMLEYQNGWLLSIQVIQLITALRIAVENGEGILDKEATSHDDMFDSFRLFLRFWH